MKHINPSISLLQIRHFVAVFEEGGFSRAAERENSAQPGLSVHVRNLENTLGQPLFERSVSGVTPTPAGRRFYRHAVSILRSVRAAEHEMIEMSGQVSGVVRAGLIPSAVRGLLPALLPRFVDEHPHVDLRLVQAYSGTLTEWVLSDELDFALVIEPPARAGLEITRFSEERMVLITGRALGLRPWRPVRLGDLPPLRLVVPTERHGLRSNIDRSIKTANLTLERLLEMDAMQGAFEFVGNSDWATILPMTAVLSDLESARLCFNPIIEPSIKSDFYLIHPTRNPLSESARVFVDVLHEAGEGIADAWDKAAESHTESA